MKLIEVNKLEPGLVVARSVKGPDGKILLRCGVTLNYRYIAGLQEKELEAIFVEGTPSGDDSENTDGNIDLRTRRDTLRALQDAYENIQRELGTLETKSPRTLNDSITSETASALISEGGVLDKVYDMAAIILQELSYKRYLTRLDTSSPPESKLYEHSLNVAIVSIMIGQAARLSRPRLEQLARGSMLHDIGMIFLHQPKSWDELVSQHTTLGYQLLKTGSGKDIIIPHVAFEHHEFQDGSGLPRGLVGADQLERNRYLPGPVPTLAGEIVVVANMYVSFLEGYKSLQPFSPEKACRIVRRGAGKRFNQSLIQHFLDRVPAFPKGSNVIVESGEYQDFKGTVVRPNPSYSARPLIRVLYSPEGEPIDPVDIDLYKVSDVTVRSAA